MQTSTKQVMSSSNWSHSQYVISSGASRICRGKGRNLCLHLPPLVSSKAAKWEGGLHSLWTFPHTYIFYYLVGSQSHLCHDWLSNTLIFFWGYSLFLISPSWGYFSAWLLNRNVLGIFLMSNFPEQQGMIPMTEHLRHGLVKVDKVWTYD